MWYQQDNVRQGPQLPTPALKVAAVLALNQEEKGMNKGTGSYNTNFYVSQHVTGIELNGHEMF